MTAAPRFLLALTSLVAPLAAAAQQRLANPLTVLVPQAQVEMALAGNDYLLAAYSPVVFTGAGYRTRLEQGQLSLGYEHFWSEHWSGGATLRYVPRTNRGNGELLGLPGSVVPGLLVRHRGALGPVSLGQRLGVEYVITRNQLVENDNRALARLRLDAERIFALGDQFTLRPRLAYEAVAYLRFQRDENQLKERTLDFGSLRAEVGVRFSPRFDLTPWFAYQTIYRNSLPFFNSAGEQVSGGRTNFVTPVAGLDLRLTLFRGGAVTERQPLPSQH
ncbi:hypothetical protein [Hymenobacter persicinus]|uniref:DUF2490 domain-containing protein n=1 Tax=Hymenobacter persicinus TaxID=2025506 RepID=A0A4Q5LG57_9BACT|nr:hypothetical protein [Hymenobacter persicinus]RYU84329.1 hypothetical protein EWM57_01150 [Hymenobacter persicinus]